MCAQVGTSTTWKCDPNHDGTSIGADYRVIYGGPNLCDGDDYCAFGANSEGNSFYCHWTDTSMRTLHAFGNPSTSETDNISFWYDEGSLEFDLDTHTSGTLVDGIMFLQGGDDNGSGSRVHSTDYADKLHGDAGDDTIDGLGGEDTITGDGGNDVLDGGSEDDTIRGGAGNDEITGGTGADILFGGDGNDVLAGNGGADTIHGGDGDDDLCGDAGIDSLFGDAGDDILLAGTVSTGESNNGGTEDSADTCDDHGASNSNCETEATLSRATDTSCP